MSCFLQPLRFIQKPLIALPHKYLGILTSYRTNMLNITNYCNKRSLMSSSKNYTKSTLAANLDERHHLHIDLMKIFPDIIHDVTGDKSLTLIPDVADWLTKVLEYTVPTGANNCAIDLLFAYKSLAAPEQLTPQNLLKTQIMSWCAEILVSVIFVTDDLMDGSQLRRGKPCWYRKDDIGIAAVNDCFLMESAVYVLLRKHFASEPYYTAVLEIFHNAMLRISMGQCLDLLTSQFGRSTDLKKFTMDRYSTLVRHKSSDLFIYLPIALPMHMLGKTDKELANGLEKIQNFAHFIQVENDYLDCYGDPKITGKEGTDIQNGAMTWLIITALNQQLTTNQRKTLQECYGSPDPEAIAKVKQVYIDLKMEKLFANYKEQSYQQSRQNIEAMSPSSFQDLLLNILDKIYLGKSYTCA